MQIEVCRVENRKDLESIARVRYEVTVAEMQLSMRYACHVARMVMEPLDDAGHIFMALADNKVVGTVRTNLLRECDVGEYYEAYGISQLDAAIDRATVSISTRLAVLQPFRSGRAPILLAKAIYAELLRTGITHDVIDSRLPRVPFFQHLGYVPHSGDYQHPEFGPVVVQRLSVHDEAHLASVKSPFLGQLREFIAMTATGRPNVLEKRGERQ